MSPRVTKLLATFFYLGDFPFAPGTLASFAALLLYVTFFHNLLLYGLIFIVVTVVGFMVSGKIEEVLKQKDPSCVVIDEVAGGLLAFIFLPMTWPVLITAFFLFRAFDMFKTYPMNKIENLKGSTGIMTDDLIAGIYTNITMHIAIRLAGIL
jgi:phosphatidylglycerophosphatase A